ncbi:heavy metal translocating P-type ATPase [Desulfovibrio sulfodismutans]|uniref:P-type Zn(2+) transporter n=1 Tax=Desulfolutivibrio sulfodismutans TaxID=63561 RepID=A0A7K3NMB1_9BACT|nr:heavy metal translocating P-type ATPase [Desulfolutivibrio sulfodismutans]NDY56915.1 heavy metal translocating P-type ATPase [Desulfolutivibrio sulfodismutans]
MTMPHDVSPLRRLPVRDVRVVHELPRRIRLKGGLFRHPRLNPDRLEAHLASLPGVERVRTNPYAGSLVVRHDGLPGRTGDILAALGALPPVVFVKGPARPREISRMDIGLHLLAAVASFAVPPVVRLVLAVLVGLPVVVDGVKNLLSRGFTAKSLDAASVGLCLAVRNYPSVCAIALMRIFGDYLKQTNDKRSNDLLHSLLRLKQQAVWVEREGVEIEVAPGDVAVGDVVVCGPGELVAVDGEVLAGAALVDKSMITGESIPVSLEKGDEVISGSVVESGRLRIRAKKVGVGTAMAKVRRFLENALEDRSLPEIRGDAMADSLAPATLALGALAYAFTRDLSRTASVTSIDYVCSVKFPARLSVRSSMYAAARGGVLLKGGRALDALARVDAVVFDKTGTLTSRELRVTDVIALRGWTREALLTLAARMEQHYDHPVARTILAEALRCDLRLDPVGEVDLHVSHGVCAVVDGKECRIGSRRFMSDLTGLERDRAETQADMLREQGKMALYVAQGNVVQGLIGLRDELRPHAQTALHGLRELGVKKVVVLTGDHRRTAEILGAQLEGVDAIHWELTPEGKACVVNELKSQGYCVAVVGDGVNDAPALVSADLGMCMPHGGDLAQASAQAILLSDDLRSLCTARRIAMRQTGILRRCLHEGAAANTALLGLAASGILSPLAAAVLHNMNTFTLMGYAMAKAGSPCGGTDKGDGLSTPS